jgi:hypothetical protein
VPPQLQERFGISCGRTGGDAPARAFSNLRGIVRGTTAPKPMRICRSFRESCNAQVPIELIDREIKHGLCHLINRGIIPRHSDLSQTLCGPASVFNANHVTLLPHADRFTTPAAFTHLKESAAWRQAHLDELAAADAKARDAACAVEHATESNTEANGSPHAPPEEDPSGRSCTEQVKKREYEQLMDEHSEHMIIFRRGRVLEETPEFESYRRKFADDWDALAAMLLQIESICVQYAVPLAVVNGKLLAELCRSLDCGGGGQVPMERLLVCIDNIQEVAAVLRQPGRRFAGPDGRAHAATTIQAHIRSYLQHKVSACPASFGQHDKGTRGGWRQAHRGTQVC